MTDNWEPNRRGFQPRQKTVAILEAMWRKSEAERARLEIEVDRLQGIVKSLKASTQGLEP